MRTIVVEVTQEDIDNGQAKLGAWCPIALAVRRGSFPKAMIGPKEWHPTGVPDLHIPLSRAARRFVAAFDAHKPVHPARFRLRVPA